MKSTQQHSIRLTALAAAMTTALYAGNAAAVQRSIHAATGLSNSNNFTMLNPFGNTVGGTNNVNVNWDGTVFTDSSDYTGPGSASNVTAASTTPFFGYTWTAHDIQVFTPGSYTFDTTQGGGAAEVGNLNVTVGAGQLGMHMLFDWNGNLNIDVFIVLDRTSVFGAGIGRNTTGTYSGGNNCDGTGTVNLTNCLYDGKDFGTAGKPAGNQVWMLSSVDGDADTLMGIPMAAGGPFAGFNANFNFNLDLNNDAVVDGSDVITGSLAPLVLDDTVVAINPNGSTMINIVANDSDIDAGGAIVPANVTITISNETNGTASDNGDGTVTWTNTSGTTGTDSFTYTLTDADGNVSAQATVTIPVGIGAPPVANDDPLLATNEDTPLTITSATDLLGNDTDVEDTTPATVNSFTQPPLGKGTITDQMDGTLLYTPPADFNGVATFTYTALDSDSNVSNTATATITVAAVNDAPVAQDNSATASYNTPTTITVLGNDSDADGDTLTVTGTSTPTSGSVQINGDNTITYTPNNNFSGGDSFTYDISDGNGGTDTASVTVTVLGQANFVGDAVPNTPTSSEITGGSNFSMLDAFGADVGGTNDILASWDGTIRADTADTSPNMTIESTLPTPFFGFTWVANNVRVFGPGSYSFETCPGGDGSTRCTFPQPLTMTVGPTQVGMHMLFDWGQPGSPTPCGLANCNIDVVQVLELNQAFAGANDGSNNFGAAGAVFTMASVDGNADGIAGVPMVDGAFIGFNANFNLNLTPQFALPVVTAVASQGGNPTSVIVPGGGNVTITATAPAGATFDWDSSLLGQQTDAALVAVNTNGTTSQTFVFDPATLPDGPLTARVTIRDPNKGNLANYAVVPMMVSASTLLADAADANQNGIPDGQDFGLPATQIPSQAGNGATYLIQSSAGALRLGQAAAAAGASTGSYAASVTAAGIGVTDTSVTNSCVGGCFDYEVTGLANGATINVVLPLSEAIPADAVARKFANGGWRIFSLLGGDALASAPGGPGTCPAPGDAAYQSGLNGGDFCLQLTITDGGRNDADGTANGTVVDPVGLGGAVAASAPTVSAIGDPSYGGGCTLSTTTKASQRLDLWLLGTLLAWLGVRRKAKQ